MGKSRKISLWSLRFSLVGGPTVVLLFGGGWSVYYHSGAV